MTVPDHEVVAALATFVGRSELLAAADRMLEERTDDGKLAARLVTLHGPGGVGKTRAAANIIAARHRPDDGFGAWMVDLTGMDGKSGVFAHHFYDALVRVIGYKRNGQVTPAVLGDHFAAAPAASGLGLSRVLLVLDNCEDVIHELRPLVEDLLAVIPFLQIIATSQTPFRREVERILQVDPLELDDSVTLFRALARAAAPTAVLDDTTAIEDLCRRLHGLPLAIQLASTWLPGLSIADLIELLGEDPLSMLTTPDSRGGTNDRHAKLERVLSVSYHRCSPDAQLAWRLLSTFRQGFDRKTATAIARNAGLNPPQTLGLIAELVDRAVIYVADTTPTQYRMFGALRDYGLRELKASGDLDQVLDQHLTHFGNLVENVAQTWLGPDEINKMLDVHRQLDDIIAAIERALSKGDPIRAAVILGNLVATRTQHFTGSLDIVAELLRRVVAALDLLPDTEDRALVLASISAAAGWVMVTQGRAEEARAAADRAAAELARHHLVPPPQVLFALGSIEALRIGSRESIGMLAAARMMLPLVPGTAGAHHLATMMWAMAHAFSGEPEAAVAAAAVYLEQAETYRGDWSIAWAVWVSALAALRIGNLAAARRHMDRCLRLEQGLGDEWGIIWALELAAWLRAAEITDAEKAPATTAAEDASRLLGAATERRRKMGVDLGGLGPLAAGRAQSEKQIRTVLSEAEFRRHVDAGRRQAADAIAEALREPVSRPAPPATAGSPTAMAALTDREREVLKLLADGLSNVEIAAELHLGEETVKTHIRNGKLKLGLSDHSRVALANWVRTGRTTAAAARLSR